jgi:two-component system NtrC family response regulator
VSIEIPPLRRRRSDIPALVQHFLEKYAALGYPARSFSREAMDVLVRHPWPGNVRELENVVQQSLVLARRDIVGTEDLAPSVREQAGAGGGSDLSEACFDERRPLPERLEAMARGAIEKALDEAGGNQSRAATRLGISERALRYKLAKYR